jgi:DNA-nicking Smr family endonuclease
MGFVMKPSRNNTFHRPFSDLQTLVEKKRLNLAPLPEFKPDRPPPLTKQQEDELFAQAMDDVTPLDHNRHWQLPHRPLAFQETLNHEEEDGVAALQRLIRTGQGFRVSLTGEYMEACRPGADPRTTRRLHHGRYAIQDYIDLHGLYAGEAEPVLHRFITQSARRGFQAVLIIHGRGLKSARTPVLKAKVFEWLTRGPLRAHVIALASARACDGGSGATYVLLRRRPLSKRLRKNKRPPN